MAHIFHKTWRKRFRCECGFEINPPDFNDVKCMHSEDALAHSEWWRLIRQCMEQHNREMRNLREDKFSGTDLAMIEFFSDKDKLTVDLNGP